LSCAWNKTHGKDLVCRAFSPRHTAKYFFLFHTPKKWNIIFLKKTLSCARNKKHGKDLVCVCFLHDARQSISFT
jgi:uncharacterized protein YsxB (DUF464 family)